MIKTGRIKLQNKNSILLILILAVLFAIGILAAYFTLTDPDVSPRTRGRAVGLGVVLLWAIPALFQAFFDKTPYVSEIEIYEDCIVLIYKKGTKLFYKRKIYKNEIISFKGFANINVSNNYKSSSVSVFADFEINLKNGEKITFDKLTSLTESSSPYAFIYDIFANYNEIPNFEFKYNCDNPFIKEKIEYFQKNGCTMPFGLSTKRFFKVLPVFSKIALIIFSLCFMVFIGLSIYCLKPMPKLTSNEQYYFQSIKSAISLRGERRYKDAIEKLDEVKIYLKDDPKIYIEYAYNYFALNDFDNVIKYSKIGLEKVKNKSVYDKGMDFRYVKSAEKTTFYYILARAYKKQGNWKMAADCYKNIIENTKSKYTNAYFEYAKMLYMDGEKELAKENFLKHKQIILDYLDYQSKTKYKSKYPLYTEKDLRDVYYWSKKCD